MENSDNLLEEFNKFEQSGNEEDIPATLDEFLKYVAKTGDPLFPWLKIKHLIRCKLSLVMADFYDFYGGEEMFECPNVPPFSYIPTRNKILQHFDSFTGVPFTIQRVCEILIDPMKHYKRTDKFLRGLEKNILVVSFVEPGRAKRKLENQQENLINGLLDDSDLLESPEKTRSSGAKKEMDDHLNGSNTTSNGMTEENSSSSSSSCSSASSSPIPEEDQEINPPLPKRRRLDMAEEDKPQESVEMAQITQSEEDLGTSDQKISNSSEECSEELEASSDKEVSQETAPSEDITSETLPFTKTEKCQGLKETKDETTDSGEDNTQNKNNKKQTDNDSEATAASAEEITLTEDTSSENSAINHNSEADSTSQQQNQNTPATCVDTTEVSSDCVASTPSDAPTATNELSCNVVSPSKDETSSTDSDCSDLEAQTQVISTSIESSEPTEKILPQEGSCPSSDP